MLVLVDVHGSCVSRSCFNLIDQSKIQVQNFFSRNNIVSCMMPPAELEFSHGELLQYSSEYSERCMRFALNKQTVPTLLDSNAEYLVVDLFDFCQPVASYRDTTFSTYDYTFYNTAAYQAQKAQFAMIDFIDVPPCLWYCHVDRYFQLMMEKFKGKVILNRLSCSNIYLTGKNTIKDIPENLRFFGDSKYNHMLYDLENYIIDNHCPFVVDISKYFIPDEHYNADTTAVHYEEAYEILQSRIIMEIIEGNGRRYFDTLPLPYVSDLLERPVSDQEFLDIYSQRALPFETNTVLDYFFQVQEMDEVVKNRRFIASIYRQFYQAGAGRISCQETVEHVLNESVLWVSSAALKAPLVENFFQYLYKVNRFLKLGIPALYASFLSDLNGGNVPEWMFKLNLLSIVAPRYEDIPVYLSQFYQAVGDDFSLRKHFLDQSI